MAKKKIDIIGRRMSKLLSEKKIISRYELLQRTYQFVREADLDESDQEELKKMLEKNNVAVGIFFNLLSGEPIFINLPKLDSVRTINDRIFHFVHTGNYTDKDFEKAYKQFQDDEKELNALAILNLEELLVEFMSCAGYNLSDDFKGEAGAYSSEKLTFTGSEGKKMNFLIYPRIGHVMLTRDMEGSTIIVPQEESPEPFIAFFHENGSAAEKSDVEIWVANMEAGTIDPFIGSTKDMAIYKQFKNPKLALRIKAMWGLKR
ncbi:MAG: DUF6834 family protein [Methanotrichaceae archaeon]